MAYIDRDFFEAYTSTVIPEDEFSVLAERAGDVIDMVTLQRIPRAGGITALSAADQLSVKKATAAQLEMMYIQGGLDTVTGDGGAVSAGIGKFAYQRQNVTQYAAGVPLSPLVGNYLLMTGLMYRGLNYEYAADS